MKAVRGIFMAALILTTTLTSCQKEQEKIAPTPVNEVSEVNKTLILDQTALALAKTLNDVELRSAIKTEALKKFDGDYDILYKDFKNRTFSDGNTLVEKLEKAHIANKSAKVGALSSLTETFSNLQISVPVNIENWNTEKFEPLVAIIPVDVLEGSYDKIKAYDSQGNIHWLDSHTAPNFPVVAVGKSERVDENGNLLFNTPKEIDTKNARRNGASEYINYIKVSQMDQIEGWVKGEPELRAILTSGKGKIGDFFFYPSRRRDINGVWWYANRYVFPWYQEEYTKTVLYTWLEVDGDGTTITVTGNFTYKDTNKDGTEITGTAGFSYVKKTGDMECGAVSVHMDDPIGREYDTGILQWTDKSI